MFLKKVLLTLPQNTPPLDIKNQKQWIFGTAQNRGNATKSQILILAGFLEHVILIFVL